MVKGDWDVLGAAWPESRLRAVDLPDAEYVALGLVVPVGFADDPSHAPGAAHLCEHLALRAARLDSPDSPVVSAVTLSHTTVFRTETVPAAADEALRALLRIARPEPGFPGSGTFTQERSVVALELSMTAASPMRSLGARVAGMLAPGTGLAREHDATPASVTSLPEDVVVPFLHRHYQLSRAALVVAGKGASDVLNTLAEEGDPGAAAFPSPARRAVPEDRRARGRLPYWGVAVPLPAAGERPAWYLSLVDAVLRPGGPVNRLARSLEVPQVGTAVLTSPLGGLAVSAHRPPPDPDHADRTASALRGGLAEEADAGRTAPATLSHAARAHAAARSRLTDPAHARDALLADVQGLGPTWDSWAEDMEPSAAAALLADLLRDAVPWQLAGGTASAV
ncbi:insulinase family protein [Streptomyces olindensis]|uniref:insulinase family protein n=1 Tax=Streptomyces olindensis TaxID=358823 RepID=UPI0033E53371